MNIVALEWGDRPALYTKARRFAPEGVKLLAETLGHMEFADDALIVLDWSNESGRQPEEVAKPIVFINVFKNIPGFESPAMVEVRLDVDDTFGRDEIMAEDFLVIIRSMEDKMNEFIERAKEN